MKVVKAVSDLFIGYNVWIDGVCWVYLGKTHRPFFGNQLYRWLVVSPSGNHSEFLSEEGCQQYVFSKV